MPEIRTLEENTTTGAAPKKTAKKSTKKTSSNGSSFAVIATGGKQYKVSEGESIKIEKLKGDHKEGDKVTFDEVLLVDSGETKIGSPKVAGAKVEATIEKIGRAKKVVVIKYKQKSRYFKKNGHRQPYFQVKVTSIK